MVGGAFTVRDVEGARRLRAARANSPEQEVPQRHSKGCLEKRLTIAQEVAPRGLFAVPIRKGLRSVNVALTGAYKSRWAQMPFNMIASTCVALTSLIELAISLIELLSMLLLAPILISTKKYGNGRLITALDQVITQVSSATLRLLAPLSIITGVLGAPLRIRLPIPPPPALSEPPKLTSTPPIRIIHSPTPIRLTPNH